LTTDALRPDFDVQFGVRNLFDRVYYDPVGVGLIQDRLRQDGAQSGQGAVLGDAYGARTHPEHGAGFLGRQAGGDAQPEDLALRGWKLVQQRRELARGLEFAGGNVRARSSVVMPVGDFVDRGLAAPSARAVCFAHLVLGDAEHPGQRRAAGVDVARQGRHDGD